ncbi:MAG TPA: cyclic nucleotide-binding domain-containing protein, partial [Thermoanaerobaculia bacterium]|nr:cyclic nucleotide-binding domain-containing protein [Thermoanaerobaculia bacterium]
MTIAETLRPWESFSHFSDDQLERLAAGVARRHYDDGEAIVRHRDSTREAYAIEAGGVAIQRTSPYGEFRLALLGTSDLFGETSFVDGGERSGDAVALGGCDLLVFDPATLDTLVEDEPALHVALYWTFWKSLSSKLRSTNERLTRFFSETGSSTAVIDRPDAFAESGAFHVELRDKRRIFEEQKLSGLEINFLSSLSKEQKLDGGEVIFNEGDPGEAMYVVHDGRVMISKFIPGAGEEALAFLERGDYFGEMALIDNQPRSADARADGGGAVVLAIPREVVEGILDIRKVSSLRLLKLLCALVARRLRELDEKIVGWH